IEGLPMLFDEFNIDQVHQAIFNINEFFADRATEAARKNSFGLEAAQVDEAALKMELEQDKSGANAGIAFAMRLLARRYERGNGVEQDSAQAIKWYRAAAVAGDANAMEELGNLYFRGREGEKDAVQAMDWWRKSAEAGNGQAMASLGKIFLGGYGIP